MLFLHTVHNLYDLYSLLNKYALLNTNEGSRENGFILISQLQQSPCVQNLNKFIKDSNTLTVPKAFSTMEQNRKEGSNRSTLVVVKE